MTLVVSDQYLPLNQQSVFVRCWAVAASARAPIILLHDSLGSVAQ